MSNNIPFLFLDLDVEAVGLPLWSWDFGPASFLIETIMLFLDLDVGALDVSFGTWASGSASFLMTNHYCFWAWMMGHWTWPFEAGPSAQLHS